MLKKLAILKDTYFCFFAILFVILAIIGGFRNYSPVPFWDMWNGYLDFYTKVSAGDLSAWWAQHNEHRIVLGRIFFWLDIRYFHGQGWLLIIVNYLLISFATAVIVMAGKKLLDQKEDRYLLWFLVAWMFFWSQEQNLTWGFQSEFFLAFLLPLVSILLLWRSNQSTKSDAPYFGLSLLTGVACIGSMANGVISLPLLFVYSLFLKISWRRSLLVFILSVLCLSLYFHGYQSPSDHSNLVAVIKTDFFGLVRYTARYLGSPFAYVIGDHSFRPVVEVLGFFVIFFTGYQLVNNYLKGKADSLNFALLTFITYVVGTAFVTAGGRLIFGLDQAFESRYTTPAIMVWSVVFLILAQSIKRKRNLMVIALGVLLLCMLPKQLGALKNQTSSFTERSMAALSLALNLRDEDQIKSILPSAKWGLELSKVPREKGYSIFGYGDIHNLVSFLNSKAVEIEAEKECGSKVYVDKVRLLDKNSDEKYQYMLISGWLFNQESYSNYDALQIVNTKKLPVGVGFVGIERPDVASVYGKIALYSGFKAYIKFDKNNKDFFIRNINGSCWTSFKLDRL
jgi:hypothetical protein